MIDGVCLRGRVGLAVDRGSQHAGRERRVGLDARVADRRRAGADPEQAELLGDARAAGRRVRVGRLPKPATAACSTSPDRVAQPTRTVGRSAGPTPSTPVRTAAPASRPTRSAAATGARVSGAAAGPRARRLAPGERARRGRSRPGSIAAPRWCESPAGRGRPRRSLPGRRARPRIGGCAGRGRRCRPSRLELGADLDDRVRVVRVAIDCSRARGSAGRAAGSAARSANATSSPSDSSSPWSRETVSVTSGEPPAGRTMTIVVACLALPRAT